MAYNQLTEQLRWLATEKHGDVDKVIEYNLTYN